MIFRNEAESHTFFDDLRSVFDRIRAQSSADPLERPLGLDAIFMDVEDSGSVRPSPGLVVVANDLSGTAGPSRHSGLYVICSHVLQALASPHTISARRIPRCALPPSRLM
jgi:hypothetical protein